MKSSEVVIVTDAVGTTDCECRRGAGLVIHRLLSSSNEMRSVLGLLPPFTDGKTEAERFVTGLWSHGYEVVECAIPSLAP